MKIEVVKEHSKKLKTEIRNFNIEPKHLPLIGYVTAMQIPVAHVDIINEKTIIPAEMNVVKDYIKDALYENTNLSKAEISTLDTTIFEFYNWRVMIAKGKPVVAEYVLYDEQPIENLSGMGTCINNSSIAIMNELTVDDSDIMRLIMRLVENGYDLVRLGGY